MAKREDKFWLELAKEAGLDDAAQKQFLATVKNEKAEKLLYDSLVPREESDRHLSEAQKVKTDAEAAQQRAVTKYNENLVWLEQNKGLLSQAQQAEAYQRQVAAYEALYGPLNGQVQPANGNQQPANGNGNGQKYLTAEELQAAQRNYWMLQKQLRKAETLYQKKFGEPMPDEVIDELEAMAQKPENANRNLTDMFNDWVAPKLDAKNTADIEERIKKAKEEAYQQGLSKGRMRDPATDNPEDGSPLYRSRPDPANKPDSRALMSNFLQSYEEGMAKP